MELPQCDDFFCQLKLRTKLFVFFADIDILELLYTECIKINLPRSSRHRDKQKI